MSVIQSNMAAIAVYYTLYQILMHGDSQILGLQSMRWAFKIFQKLNQNYVISRPCISKTSMEAPYLGLSLISYR